MTKELNATEVHNGCLVKIHFHTDLLTLSISMNCNTTIVLVIGCNRYDTSGQYICIYLSLHLLVRETVYSKNNTISIKSKVLIGHKKNRPLNSFWDVTQSSHFITSSIKLQNYLMVLYVVLYREITKTTKCVAFTTDCVVHNRVKEASFVRGWWIASFPLIKW